MPADSRRLAIAIVSKRAQLRSAGEDEISAVIHEEALREEAKRREREQPPKSSSTPAPAKGIVAVLNTLPPWSRPVVLVVFGCLLGGGGLLAILTRLGWVK